MTYNTAYITYAVIYISRKEGCKVNFESFINSQLMFSGKILSIMKRDSHRKGRKKKKIYWSTEIGSNRITTLRHIKILFCKGKWNAIIILRVWHNLRLLSEPPGITCLPLLRLRCENPTFYCCHICKLCSLPRRPQLLSRFRIALTLLPLALPHNLFSMILWVKRKARKITLNEKFTYLSKIRLTVYKIFVRFNMWLYTWKVIEGLKFIKDNVFMPPCNIWIIVFSNINN